jgi:hypothetical protein
MSKENEVRDALNNAAKEIVRVDSNPSTWRSWLVYLMERLDEESVDNNPMHQDSFREMLAALQENLRNRLNTGGW